MSDAALPGARRQRRLGRPRWALEARRSRLREFRVVSEAAQAQLVKAKQFMKAAQFKAARIEETK